MFNRLTPVVKNILLVNLAIFLIGAVFSLDLAYNFGLWGVFSGYFAPYQLITYMWLHANFSHVFWNMIGVFVFGPMLEQVWGSKRFLIFYLIVGIGAGAITSGADILKNYSIRQDKEMYLQNPTPESFEVFVTTYKSRKLNSRNVATFAEQFYSNAEDREFIAESKSIVNKLYQSKVTTNTIGASGALLGIVMAFAMLFPNMELMLLFPPIPVKAKYLALGYAAIDIYGEISRAPGDNVAHLAHLGGMLIAFILLKFFWNNLNQRYY